MIFIEHRKNKLADLEKVDPAHGVEIDLRSDSKQIILAHDAFSDGESLNDWLTVFVNKKINGPLILNTKEDLLEDYILKILQEKKISNFLFLDTAFPTFLKYALTPMASKFMLRLSNYESLDMAKMFSGNVEWLWVDCFAGKPVEKSILKAAAKEFKLCMVSPELQGQDLNENFDTFHSISMYFSAICTKQADKWKSVLK